MVKRLKLNEKILREAEPKPGVSYQIFDAEVIGFAARVQASGARTFTIDYRHAGRQRRMTIGRWPEWSVTAARERAKELRRAIDEGQDPLAMREDMRGAPRFPDLIKGYLREHATHLAPRNAADQESTLRKLIEPHWKHRLVAEVRTARLEHFDLERGAWVIRDGLLIETGQRDCKHGFTLEYAIAVLAVDNFPSTRERGSPHPVNKFHPNHPYKNTTTPTPDGAAVDNSDPQARCLAVADPCSGSP